MTKTIQTSFGDKKKATHGGLPSKGKRKVARPFSKNCPTHLVLHSKRAKGLWSLLHRKNHARIQSMVYVYAKRFHIQLYRVSVLHDTIHLFLKAKDRKNLADYLRVLAGRVAIATTGAQKHKKQVGKFWDYLYWSRLVRFGHDFFVTRAFFVEKLSNLAQSETITRNELNLNRLEYSGEWG